MADRAQTCPASSPHSTIYVIWNDVLFGFLSICVLHLCGVDAPKPMEWGKYIDTNSQADQDQDDLEGKLIGSFIYKHLQIKSLCNSTRLLEHDALKGHKS